jgi:alpha-mannosidase
VLPITAQRAAAGDAPDFCLFLADHWSYTGIGWTSGLKSCAQSIVNCIEMADYDPSVRTGINLDAHAYELVAEKYPEVIARLKPYLAAGKVEIIGATYGQPMGSMLTGESNLRQLVCGQRAIRKSLGVFATTFLEEEECTHPQLPQLLRGAGYRFASLAQCDTWGNAGNPLMELNVFEWCSPDGTSLLATPNNGLRFHPPAVTHDIDWLWSDEGRAEVKKLQQLGMPLAVKWVEFGWGSKELTGGTANKFYATMFRQLSHEYRVRYTTLTEYLDQFGSQSKQRVCLRMDDFHKLDPWGVGGDQLRRTQRETEAALAAAERFDAVAQLVGLDAGHAAELEEAWQHLLISQSHDVSLCEHWVDASVNGENKFLADPTLQEFLDRTGTPEENRDVKTWGDVGFRHLRLAKEAARKTLAQATTRLSAAIDTARESHGELAIVVFNPCAAARDGVATTGPLPLRLQTGEILEVRDAQGSAVACQALEAEKGEGGNSVAFAARNLPALGYVTYYVAKGKPRAVTGAGELKASDTGFHIENSLLSVTIDEKSGAITALTDRRQGHDLIRGERSAFPVYTGRPNRDYPGAEKVPESFDSRESRAEVRWVERGPVRATVRVVHTWPKLQFEHWISLDAGAPYVDVRVRVRADVPPRPGEGKINGWQFPIEIEDGYWLWFAPAFTPEAVIRDFPFGVELATKPAAAALTFVDLAGADGGLLLVHGGTQYFKRGADGTFANLILREWNSHFVAKQFGWPRTAEYRYRLLAHGKAFTNADRLRAVEAFDQSPVAVVEPLHGGKLACQRSFASVEGSRALISSLRGVGDGAYEVRLIEQEGVAASARVKLDLPLKEAAPCDLLGRTSAATGALHDGVLSAALGPWQIKTFRLK